MTCIRCENWKKSSLLIKLENSRLTPGHMSSVVHFFCYLYLLPLCPHWGLTDSGSGGGTAKLGEVAKWDLWVGKLHSAGNQSRRQCRKKCTAERWTVQILPPHYGTFSFFTFSLPALLHHESEAFLETRASVALFTRLLTCVHAPISLSRVCVCAATEHLSAPFRKFDAASGIASCLCFSLTRHGSWRTGKTVYVLPHSTFIFLLLSSVFFFSPPPFFWKKQACLSHLRVKG